MVSVRPVRLTAGHGPVVAILVALIPLSRHPRFQSLFEFEEGSSFFRVQLWQSALRMIASISTLATFSTSRTPSRS